MMHLLLAEPLWRHWWSAPLVMCLIVTGILGYLGIHVLTRKVIFVDLATAQIAALGAAYAIVLGYEPEENEITIYLFSLGFALAGAIVIALTRMKKERVPHEAFIGIIYASASAISMLVLSKSHHETDQIKAMLVGSLLTVSWKRVLITFVICAAIGAFHWIYRRNFFLISTDAEAAEKAGVSVRLWDFLFYFTFGIVITSCVSIAGVLLVFSYLVVPAVISVMFADRTPVRVGICWGIGTLVSVVGMFISYYGNPPNGFPTGPSIVAGFTGALIIAGLIHYVVSHEHSGIAVRRLAIGGAVIVLAFWASRFLKHEDEHSHTEGDLFSQLTGPTGLGSENEGVVLDTITHIVKSRDRHFVAPLLKTLEAELESKKHPRIVEHAGEALADFEAAEALPALVKASRTDFDDPDLQITIARSILRLHDPGGFPPLIDIVEKEPTDLPRQEAKKTIADMTGLKLDPDDKKAAEQLRAWWKEKGPALKWHGQTLKFE